MGAKGKLRICEGGYNAYCPGCETYHLFDGRWQFNGDFNKPTFTPSLVVNESESTLLSTGVQDGRCHSFVTDGVWRFLVDSTHELRGRKVEMRNEESQTISAT